MSRSCDWAWAKTENKAIDQKALNTISSMRKECADKEYMGEENPTFTVPKLNKYTVLPANGNCKGDENNLLTVLSTDLSKYPTYSYDVETGAMTCSHDAPTEERHSCSARSNGQWGGQ